MHFVKYSKNEYLECVKIYVSKRKNTKNQNNKPVKKNKGQRHEQADHKEEIK